MADLINAFSVRSLSLSPIPTKLPSSNFSRQKPNPLLWTTIINKPKKLQIFSSTTSFSSTATTDNHDPRPVQQDENNCKEKFQWYSQWYPVALVCDMDKRVPHAKRVMGLDLVVWWDRNKEKWQVFDDTCPHRLAPLSEGRIDQWGRLQCVYHGWCFDGAGDCKFIPQAPRDGPPVHTFKKACASAYPCVEQHNIVWFWPSTDPQYKNIAMEKRPPYIPEFDDPSYSSLMGTRDIPLGYEVFVENIMDSSHVPYAHYGMFPWPDSSEKLDREGGMPMEIKLEKIDINGFQGTQPDGYSKFIPPCMFVMSQELGPHSRPSPSSEGRRKLYIYICIPISPGKTRFIWSFPRNFDTWSDQVIPRWILHISDNIVLDSDLYLLHLEEHKIAKIGPSNWQKACYVPTKADTYVIAFRRWLRKFSNGGVDFGTKFLGTPLPSPSKEELLERYKSHVVNCSSCSVAHKRLKALEVALQVISIALVGMVAVMKQGGLSVAASVVMVCMAALCVVASRWLSHFIYKVFHFHDYNHGLV